MDPGTFFAAHPTTELTDSLRLLALGLVRMYKRVLPLPPHGAQHRTRPSQDADEDFAQRFPDPLSDARGLGPRETEEPEPSEESGEVGHHGVPLQKVCKRLCGGDVVRGDAHAGEPSKGEEVGKREGGRGEGVVEECPVGDRCSGGEGVHGGYEERRAGAGVVGRRAGSDEEVEGLGSAHAPREELPEGGPVRAVGEEHHCGWECEAEEDGDEDGLGLALGEGGGPVRGRGAASAIADGRGEEEGEEVAERGDEARALELVRGAEEKVGDKDGAIGAGALDGEGEEDAGELENEVDGVRVARRVERSAKEADEGAEDGVGDGEAGEAYLAGRSVGWRGGAEGRVEWLGDVEGVEVRPEGVVSEEEEGAKDGDRG